MTVTTKQPSPELISLVDTWADSFIKSKELPVKILELAEQEGLDKSLVRELVDIALLSRGLSKRRIREILPSELKDSSQIRIRPKLAAVSLVEGAANDAKKVIEQKTNWDKDIEDLGIDKEVPVKDSTQFYKEQEEAEEPTELELAKIRIAQLEDALHKTEMFKPASDNSFLDLPKEQTLSIKTAEVEQLIENGITTEESVFKWLSKRDNKVNTYYYDAYGIKLFKDREFASFANRGVKTFKRLYFEV